MAREHNFLLGNGERLTFETEVVRSGGEKVPPYDFDTALRSVGQWLDETTDQFRTLPPDACPHDEAVAVLTMHPRYVSKSDFPIELLSAIGLRSIGGRSAIVRPRSWGVKTHPDEATTDQIFVVGTRSTFVRWKSDLNRWTSQNKGALQLGHLENLSAFMGCNKLRSIPTERTDIVLEVVLHDPGYGDVLEQFEAYAKRLNAKVQMDRCRSVHGLRFVPVWADTNSVSALADFVFVRVARAMPHLRPLQPNIMRRTNPDNSVALPLSESVDPAINVAVFDGGLPQGHPLTLWVNYIEPVGIGNPVPNYTEHGLAVTSAFLFGPLLPNRAAVRPLSNVDHVRVLDASTGLKGDFEYYDVLDRILNHLDSTVSGGRDYDFVNISLGPQIPVDDDEVTRWTSSLDERFAGDSVLATVAAGNDGERDPLTGLNRIQPPSDGVNVLAIGATDRQGDVWARASYSCVGPGRRPGLVKPDASIFGGSASEPFFVLAPGIDMRTQGFEGTSFAAPYGLRTAVSIRVQLGLNVGTLATRALLIHRAELGGNNLSEVGWGRLETDHNRMITCDDDEALVIYQDKLPVGQFLRAPVPLPDVDLTGDITISATLIIAPNVDPNYPNAYTRGGLEVVFRPNTHRYVTGPDGRRSLHPRSKSFFSQKNLYRNSEYELRDGAHKWETCLKASQRFRATSLKDPCFDVYYHSRWNGVAEKNPKSIPYALVVSVRARKMPDFYNGVVRTYNNQLVQLRPQTRIQLQV